jgi:hypothetical protein
MIKAYRYQTRYKGMYFDGIVKDIDAEKAGFKFAEKITSGEIKGVHSGAYRKDIHFITYEEIEYDEKLKTDHS